MFTVERLDDGKWHVCRGNIIVSPGYTHKPMAERELGYRVIEEYRILVSVEGGYHPQFRWNPQWGWMHFKHRVDNKYVTCKTLPEAERFMAEQDIMVYEVVQEIRA